MKIQLIDPFLIHHSDSPGLVFICQASTHQRKLLHVETRNENGVNRPQEDLFR